MRTKPRALLVEMYLSILVVAGNVHENPELEVISLFSGKSSIYLINSCVFQSFEQDFILMKLVIN